MLLLTHTHTQMLLLTELRLVRTFTKADPGRYTMHLFALRLRAYLTFIYSQLEMKCQSVLTEVGENIQFSTRFQVFPGR